MKLFKNYRPHPVVGGLLAVLHMVAALLWSVLAGRSFSDGEPVEGALSVVISLANLLLGAFKLAETAAGLAKRDRNAV